MTQDETDCPYLQQVYRNLPRLLARYNRDPSSETFGLGDRYFWSWKLIDFANGTFQGAVNGLARLIAADLLPSWLPKVSALNRITAMCEGARFATARNGSLAEALPNESSFCVTALVAADFLFATDQLQHIWTKQQSQDAIAVVRPWIEFLQLHDESHGIISNHLAVAVVALVLWQDLTGENTVDRSRHFLDIILANRSSEGWFREYEGADPGYQSWLMGSLVEVNRRRPEWNLQVILTQGFQFLQNFVHPDGSYGGSYTARLTRFVFPAGFESFAAHSSEALSIAIQLRGSIKQHAVVTLDAIDGPNLVPLFNDYVAAAIEFRNNRSKTMPTVAILPAFAGPVKRYFPEAGLVIAGTPHQYTVLSVQRGGAFVHFEGGRRVKESSGVVCRTISGRLLTTQFSDTEAIFENQNDAWIVKSKLRQVSRQLPSAWRFIVLRLLSITVFRSVILGNLVKKLLAALLVTRKPSPRGWAERRIQLGENFEVNDVITLNEKFVAIDPSAFSAIHMASQGYWQRSDDQT